MTLPRTANQAWLEALIKCAYLGSNQEARGMKFQELRAYQTTFDMRWPVVSVPERDIGMKFLPAESYWILSGSNKVSEITNYSKKIKQFSNDGVHFDGAYGPQIMDQIRYVADCLANDKGSRQAVLTIWRPNPRESKDIPCTIAMQFLIRHNQLHCIATMRSSDLWLGWVYDSFNFTMVTMYLQLLLQLRGISLGLGNMTIQAGSEHLYVRDFDAARPIVEKYVSTDGFTEWDVNVAKLKDVPHYRVPQAGEFETVQEFLAWLDIARTIGLNECHRYVREENPYVDAPSN